MCLASRPHSAARSASSPSGRSPCARRGRPASARAASIGWRWSRRGHAGRTSRRGARCPWPTRLASELDRWLQRTLLSDDDDLVFARPQTANPWAPPKTAGSSPLHLQGLDDFDAPSRDFPGSAPLVPEGAAGARGRPHSWRRGDAGVSALMIHRAAALGRGPAITLGGPRVEREPGGKGPRRWRFRFRVRESLRRSTSGSTSLWAT